MRVFIIISFIFCCVKSFGSLTLSSTTHASLPRPQSFLAVPRSLQEATKQLLGLSEARQLLGELQREGEIVLKSVPLGQSESDAMWLGGERVIVVNTSRLRSTGEKLSAILFEMQNARAHQKFLRLDALAIAGELSKEKYVEAIERLEHENALRTARLLEAGIAAGIYPSDAHWAVLRDFEDHYRLQQIMGHSDQIGKIYNHLNGSGRQQRYIGTVADLHTLTTSQRELLLQELAHKYRGSC